MDITTIDLPVRDPEGAARFYGSVLGLPVTDGGGAATVSLGSTALVLHEDDAHPGGDHLAFNIGSDRLAPAKRWLADRGIELYRREGEDEFDGPPAWRSRSVYFEGPGGSVLELIARRDVPSADSGPFGPDGLLSISEVGVAVDDVDAALETLSAHGITAYGGLVAADFAAAGDERGLLILATPGRAWMPTDDRVARPSAIRVTIRTDVPWDERIGRCELRGRPD